MGFKGKLSVWLLNKPYEKARAFDLEKLNCRSNMMNMFKYKK